MRIRVRQLFYHLTLLTKLKLQIDQFLIKFFLLLINYGIMILLLVSNFFDFKFNFIVDHLIDACYYWLENVIVHVWAEVFYESMLSLIMWAVVFVYEWVHCICSVDSRAEWMVQALLLRLRNQRNLQLLPPIHIILLLILTVHIWSELVLYKNVDYAINLYNSQFLLHFQSINFK